MKLRLLVCRRGERVRRFLRDTRAGATAFLAAVVSVMAITSSALVLDHVWLEDQQEMLKTASDAASLAATTELDRLLRDNPAIKDDDLGATLKSLVKRYLLFNLGDLPAKQLDKVKKTLDIDLDIDRRKRIVVVTAKADLGGTLFAGKIPLLEDYEGPGFSRVKAGFDIDVTPVEVVLAIDTSVSMGASYGSGSRLDAVRASALHLLDALKPDASNRVAFGVVPWDLVVRLDKTTAKRWENKSWARYPTRRKYEYPYICTGSYDKANEGRIEAYLSAAPESCKLSAVTEDLPGSQPSSWRGCLDEYRLGSGSGAVPSLPSTSTALLAPPSTGDAFAKTFFPSLGGVSYECLDPAGDVPDDMAVQECYSSSWGGPSASKAHHSETVDGREVNWYLMPNQRTCQQFRHPILPLSTDPKVVEDHINEKVEQDVINGTPVYSELKNARAGVSTNSAVGILWSLRLLLPSWKSQWGGTGAHPLDPDDPDADAEDLRKVIVFLTDGRDTVCQGQRACPNFFNSSGITRAKACSAAKQAGVEIFVVAVGPHAETELGNELRACSSQSDNPEGSYVFINNESPEHLKKTFKSIANQLRTVRRIH